MTPHHSIPQREPPVAAGTRSTFVSAVAWVFIVLAGFATLITLLQNVMVTFLLSGDAFRAGSEKAFSDPKIPPFAAFMFANMRWLFLLALALSAALLASSIGLLFRKEWARMVFVAFMVLGILWNVAGLGFMAFAYSSMGAFPMPPPGKAPMPNFDVMFKVMMGINVFMVLAFSALFGWIAKRLVSPEIRAEFRAA